MIDTIIATNLPAGHNSANAFVVVRGAGAFIDFLGDVFDAEEARQVRTPNRDGTLIHAEVRIGNATIMLADAKPDWPAFRALTQVYVADAQAVLDRAAAHGAVIVTEPTMFYGGVLIARFLDPWENLWWLYQPVSATRKDVATDTAWHAREPSYVYTSLITAMHQLARNSG